MDTEGRMGSEGSYCQTQTAPLTLYKPGMTTVAPLRCPVPATVRPLADDVKF